MPFARAPYNSSRVVLLPCIAARLGTSDRLHLTQRGLAPRKKSQTYAGALTTKAEPRRPNCQPRMRNCNRNQRRLRRIVRHQTHDKISEINIPNALATNEKTVAALELRINAKAPAKTTSPIATQRIVSVGSECLIAGL